MFFDYLFIPFLDIRTKINTCHRKKQLYILKGLRLCFVGWVLEITNVKYEIYCNISIIYFLSILGNGKRYNCIDYCNICFVLFFHLRLEGCGLKKETNSEVKDMGL